MFLIIMPKGFKRRNYRQRRDRNEKAIVDGLRRRGILVLRLEPPALDLLVGYGGVLHLLEVKDPDREQGGRDRVAGGLTPAQFDFIKKWAEYPVKVVRSLDEALRAIGYEA